MHCILYMITPSSTWAPQRSIRHSRAAVRPSTSLIKGKKRDKGEEDGGRGVPEIERAEITKAHQLIMIRKEGVVYVAVLIGPGETTCNGRSHSFRGSFKLKDAHCTILAKRID